LESKKGKENKRKKGLFFTREKLGLGPAKSNAGCGRKEVEKKQKKQRKGPVLHRVRNTEEKVGDSTDHNAGARVKKKNHKRRKKEKTTERGVTNRQRKRKNQS